MNYFELFGLPSQFQLDGSLLSSQFRELQKRFHPDNFASASERDRLMAVQKASEINDAGLPEIETLATAIGELESQIPPDINWVLRVDGHTDIDPISTAQFQSNWELSAARAIAVVKALIDRGIPPNRLVAAGFGEFQPLDPGMTTEAYRRNRRIELKLTEK